MERRSLNMSDQVLEFKLLEQERDELRERLRQAENEVSDLRSYIEAVNRWLKASPVDFREKR